MAWVLARPLQSVLPGMDACPAAGRRSRQGTPFEETLRVVIVRGEGVRVVDCSGVVDRNSVYRFWRVTLPAGRPGFQIARHLEATVGGLSPSVLGTSAASS